MTDPRSKEDLAAAEAHVDAHPYLEGLDGSDLYKAFLAGIQHERSQAEGELGAYSEKVGQQEHEIVSLRAENERLKLQIEMLTAPEQTKYLLRMYAELSPEERIKIDALMAALLNLKEKDTCFIAPSHG